MNFPIVKEYKFDITGKDPDNKIKREPIEIDRTGWTSIVVPVKGPFYTKTFSLALPDGTPLVLGKDYRFYSLMGKLTEYTGQPVACMVELLKENVNRLYATYQCLGDTSLWDSNLIKLVMSAIADDRPVWWNDLHNKPTGFPMEVHGHSFKYQIVAFQETIEFFNDVMEYIRTTPDLIQSQMIMMENIITSYIQRYSEVMEDIMTHHRDSYNAHALTKADIGLGNVDNFRTATPLETASGESNRLHMTPPGLDGLIKQFGYVPERMLAANSLPMSSFGGKRFVPPSIDGSYECLGLDLNQGAMCLEQDGTVSVLSPRFDGKQRGLYFSTIENPTLIDSSKTTFKYNAFKYRHPFLESNNADPTAIINGSDGRVLAMADTNRFNNWFIGLSNDTLDPAKHVLKKVNTSVMSGDGAHSTTRNWSIVYLEDIVVFFCHAGTSPETYTYSRLYYVNVSDLKNDSLTSVTPQLWRVTYKTPDGRSFSNTNILYYSKHTTDASGNWTQLYHKFSPAVKDASTGRYRSCNVTAATNPVDKSEQVINVLAHMYIAWANPSTGKRESFFDSGSNEIIWKRKGDTLTLVANSPILTIDYRKGSNQKTWMYFNPPEGYAPWIQGRCSDHAYQNSVILSDKMRGTMRAASGVTGMTNGVTLESFDNVNMYEVLSNLSYKDRVKTARAGWFTEIISPPFKRGLSPWGITFTRHGYIYTANSPENGSQIKTEVILNESTSTTSLSGHSWSVRPEVGNVSIGSLYSLPIADTVLETNNGESIYVLETNLTGDQTFLSSITSGYGLTMRNHGVENNFYAASNFWGDAYGTTDNGVLLKDPGGDFLYYSSSVVNQLKALVNVSDEHPIKMVEIYDLSSDVNKNSSYSGGRNFNLAIAMVTYGAANARSKYVKTVVFRPNIVSNPSNKYNSNYGRIVDSVTVLSQVDKLQNSSQSNMTSTTWDLKYWSYAPCTTMQCYVSGNTMSLYVNTNSCSGHEGNSGTSTYKGTLNLSTNVLSANTAHYSNVIMDVSFSFAVPRVGMTTCYGTPGYVSGGSALIATGDSNGLYYCLGHTYLKDGWVVYIEESELIFNGNVFKVPAGTIDLRDITSSYTNKTFYLYCRLVAGVAEYYVSLNKEIDTLYNLWIGTVITNASQIVTLERSNVLSINGIRISTVRQGSAIMGSTGTINGEGSVPWFSSSDLV